MTLTAAGLREAVRDTDMGRGVNDLINLTGDESLETSHSYPGGSWEVTGLGTATFQNYGSGTAGFRCARNP